jgi:hypothetical protein
MTEAPKELIAHGEGWHNIPYIRADVAAAQLAERDARIAALEAAQAWVSVEERLPEDDDEVLTYKRDGHGYYTWWVDSYSPIQRRWVDGSTPTHWMPLPPPPVTGDTP